MVAPSEPTEHHEELLAAAVDVALRRGRFSDPSRVSGAHSSTTDWTFKLRDSEGQPLARVPLAAARRQLQKRRQRLQRLLRPRGRQQRLSGAWRASLRLRPWEDRALAWALSSHRPAPEPAFGRRQLLLTALLLALGVLPGLLYLALLLPQRQRHARQMEALVRVWKSLGKPDPATDQATAGPDS